MKRVIVDYKKLNKDILNLLTAKFPDGYADQDIITFRNQYNEAVEALEVKTNNTIYLVKISKRLTDSMQNFDVENLSNAIPKEEGKEQLENMEEADT